MLTGDADRGLAARWCAACRCRITASTMRWTWSAATRGPAHGGPAYISEWVAWGAGPRAGQSLILAAKARAALAGRPSVSIDDIRAVALPVLRHRIVINYNAQADGESSDSIIKKLLERRPGPKGGRRCRRRGSIPILTSSPGSPT